VISGVCDVKMPEPTQLSDTHTVYCFLHEEKDD
jgi:hypothetical protein